MFGKFKDYIAKNTEGNMVLQGVGVLVGLVCLVALGGLIANEFTKAGALPEGNAFNVSTTTATYFPTVVTIAFVACLALIGLPVLAMMLGFFGGNKR